MDATYLFAWRLNSSLPRGTCNTKRHGMTISYCEQGPERMKDMMGQLWWGGELGRKAPENRPRARDKMSRRQQGVQNTCRQEGSSLPRWWPHHLVESTLGTIKKTGKLRKATLLSSCSFQPRHLVLSTFSPHLTGEETKSSHYHMAESDSNPSPFESWVDAFTTYWASIQ